jgi:hypothetical protein
MYWLFAAYYDIIVMGLHNIQVIALKEINLE